MVEDFSEEVQSLIEEFKSTGFEYGKKIEYLLFRNKINKKEYFQEELTHLKNLKFTAKQTTNGEIRYVLYFVYSRSKGRAYAVTFRDMIRIITIYPLGRTTLRKYHVQKFK